MFFQRKRSTSKASSSWSPSDEPKRKFRPTLEALEDRTVPSSFNFFNPRPQPGPATHFQVITPKSPDAEISTSIQVIALDASNRVDTNYVGTVHLSSTDALATFAVNDYTFTKYDRGSHRFQMTFGTAGSQTVTATDTVTATILGSGISDVDPAPVATHFLVVAQSQAATGEEVKVKVVALDASNHVVPNYRGTVHFGVDADPLAVLPADYTFTADDNGKHTFTVTFGTVGAQNLSMTDTATSTLTGTSAVTVNPPATTSRLYLFAVPNARSGKTFTIYVAALDASNKIVPTYTGTVHFTSSDVDAGVVLPADYTFTASDHGIKSFEVTLVTTGKQTVTATDLTTATVTGTGNVRVSALKFFGGFNFWDLGSVLGGKHY